MEYLDTAALVVLALHGAAVAVVNVTNTPAPNTTWGRVYKGIEFLAGLATARVKQKGIARLIR